MRCFIQDLILIVHYYLHLFLHGSSSLFGNHWCISRVTRSYWVKNLDLSFGVQKHAWIWMVQSDLLKWTGRTLKRIKSLLKKKIIAQKMKFSIKDFFFLSGFSFTATDTSQDSRGREGTILFHSATSITIDWLMM